MTSRNLYFKLMKEDLKRRIWAVCLAFLCFFFWIPVLGAMGCDGLEKQVEQWMESERYLEKAVETMRAERLTELAQEIIGVKNLAIPFLIVGAAIVLGLTGFSWLHSKKKVDFYHSLPVSRTMLFFVKYLDSILIVFSMYFLNLIFGCGILMMNGMGFGEVFLPGLASLFFHMIHFTLIYTVVLAAVLMTGNFFISVLGMLVFFSYIPFVTFLLEGLSQLFFETVITTGGVLSAIMRHGSPISYYTASLSEVWSLKLGEYGELFPGLFFPLLAAAALMVFCLFLYRLRPSEAAGKAMAFRITRAPIKVLIVVPVTISMGVLFWGIYESLRWAAFGFLFGLFVTHCVVEILYHFDFRKLFSNLPHAGICAVIALAVIGIYRFDLTGFDTYFPSEAKFESAAVYVGRLENWGFSYGFPVRESSSASWRYIPEESYGNRNMAVTDYDSVKAIAENGIDQALKDKEKRFRFEDIVYNSGEDEAVWSYATIQYRLSGGKTVQRQYMVNVTELRPVLDKLYVSEEYKSGVYPFYAYEDSNVTGIYLYKNHEIQEARGDEEFRSKVLAAYKREMTALTLDARSQEMPVGAIRFLTVAERSYLKELSEDGDKNYAGDFDLDKMEEVNFFPVYPSFTETIGLLKEAGIDLTESLNADEISRVVIETMEPETTEIEQSETQAAYAEAATGYVPKEYTIRNDSEENHQMISDICAAVTEETLADYNYLRSFDYNVEVRVYFKEDNEGLNPEDQIYYRYRFPDGEMPESVQEFIGYDSLEKNIRGEL